MSEEQVVDPTQDPFYDPNDTQLDLSNGPKHLADLASIANEELPPPEPEAVVPTPDPAFEPEPEIFTFEDGSTASIEKTAKGWKATLDSKTGAPPEVFYGRTKDEMYQNVMAGKIQATKKIRQQNRELKLGNQHTQQPQEVSVPRTKTLSPDEVAQLKMQLGDNPDLALDSYFQKKTGRSIEELMAMAEDGKRARQVADADNVSRAFMANTPEYHGNMKNYAAILGWISKYKLQPAKILKQDQNWDEVMFAVYDQGLWTGDVLAEAYEDLATDGLLEFAAQHEEVEEQEVTPPPPPAPVANQPVRRPRPSAGLGIRANEARGSRVAPTDPTTPQRLEDLSDAEIESLFNGIRRLPEDVKKAGIEKARQRQQV